jgi:hypothetical protein
MKKDKMVFHQVYKLDKNHHNIKQSLFDECFLVTDLASVGYGRSDLDVSYINLHKIKIDFYIEVKSVIYYKASTFTKSQKIHFTNSMRPVLVLNNVDQAKKLRKYLDKLTDYTDINSYLEASEFSYTTISSKLMETIEDE